MRAVRPAIRPAAVLAAVLVAVAALSACSTPPGPEPATPAPALPEEAIAYDDLKSTDRAFPFTNSCEQITGQALRAVGGTGMDDLDSLGGPAGCRVVVGGDELDELWIEQQAPPNPSEPRYFPDRAAGTHPIGYRCSAGWS